MNGARVLVWLIGSAFLGFGCHSSESPQPPERQNTTQGERARGTPAATDSSSPARQVADRADASAPEATVSTAQSASAEANQATARQAYVIAALGDSLTDKKSHGGGYLDYVAKRCPKSRVENYAKGGFMVNQMRRRFDRMILPQPPGTFTHLVVFGGVNDLYSDLTAGRTPQKISRDLLHIYQSAHERGMKVVAITVSPWGGFERYYNARRGESTHELNRWIRAQLAAKTVDYLVDSYPLLSCGDSERLCPDYQGSFKDGLHFGAKGHAVLGEALYELVFADCL